MGLFARFGFPAFVTQGKVLFFYKNSFMIDQTCSVKIAGNLVPSAAQWRAEGKKRKRVTGGQGTGSLDHAPVFFFFPLGLFFAHAHLSQLE